MAEHALSAVPAPDLNPDLDPDLEPDLDPDLDPDAALTASWSAAALRRLTDTDAVIVRLAAAEIRRRRGVLDLVAASSPTLPAALVAQSLLFSAITAEGYRSRRFHPGTEVVDEVEDLARTRAQDLFGVAHANVQPSSGSAANLAVLYGLLRPGQRVVALELTHGGHLSHASSGASVGSWMAADHYRVDADGFIDLDALRDLVRRTRPAILICGGSACPRALDFPAFREIADETGTLLLADISHISGLVAAGVHPSPVPVADVVTTSTYKQLRGPRGGLVLQGASGRVEARRLDRAVFPGLQGTPDFGLIAAKAVALGAAAGPAFTAAMRRTVRYARIIAAALTEEGVPLVGGGTDTHLVLADLRAAPVSGRVISEVLISAGVLVNHNLVPDDPRSATETSGLRIGANDVAFRRVSDTEVTALAGRLAAVVGCLVRGAPVGSPECVRLTAELVGCATELAARGYRPDAQMELLAEEGAER